ncbi:hypothetical protein [Streptomyces collinus]|uniref:hypothetical protein n=1 Tax=Streptomyces collinus TaxID=42684 RepID=UPI0036785F47
MTSRNEADPFVAALSGWRIATGVPDSQGITIVPVIGWQSLPDERAKRSIGSSTLKPVVLFDNTKEPITTTVVDALHGWTEGTCTSTRSLRPELKCGMSRRAGLL